MKSVFSLFGVIVLFLWGAAASAETPVLSQETLAAQIEQLQAENSAVPGFAIAVIRNGKAVSAASGVAAPDQTPMTVHTPFRLASVTKTFVAAAILRLHEQGLLNLDSSIQGLVSQAHLELLEQDGYDTAAITVRHLLMQSSGLNDHFGTAEMREMVFANPSKIWMRTEQLALMTKVTDPYAKAGGRFAYSDTGYLLLGEIIERQTGKPLGKAVAELNRFEALGLVDMVWEGEAVPVKKAGRAHQWLNGFDTFGLHGSVDAFGGGGLIADVTEIASYFDALFDGRVFDQPSTLELMKTAPGHPETSPYRLGLFRQLIGEHEAFMHGGFWGVQAIHVPSLSLTIATVALDQSGDHAIRELAFEIIKADQPN